MKKLYTVKLGYLFIFLIGFYSPNMLADYASNSNQTGNYESPEVWSTNGKFDGAPPLNGNVGQELLIESGSVITRNGDFNPVTVTVEGTFIVKGNYANDRWRGVTIEKNGKLEIFGDLTASASITVKSGGILIVHGNLSSSNAGITSHGDIIVVGDFSTATSTTIHNNGNLIVGGNFTHHGGGLNVNGNSQDTKIYILNPNAVVTGPNWSVIQNPEMVGDLEDFQEDEPNTPLGDIVNEVFVSVILGSQWKTDNVNNSWNIGENWTGNKVPSVGSNVRIKSAEYVPTILATDELVEVNNLIIEEGASLILRPGAQLTVNGKLTVIEGGTLILDHEYGEGKMASLITKGEVIGEVMTELTLPQNQWFYIGSSRKDAVFSDFGAGNEGVIINIYRAGKWWGIKSGLASRPLRSLEGLTTNFQPAEGDQNRVISYTGEIHTTSVSRTFDESGYHLMSNPYPTFIDWENANGWERTNVDGTMWYRSMIGEEMVFVAYNRNAPKFAKVALAPFENMSLEIERELSLIPPMQAVWINALEPGATLTVHPTARSHGEAKSMLKSSGSGSADVIRIETSNSLTRDGAVLYFAEGADEGFDSGDSEKMFNDAESIPEIFTRVGERSMAINGLPLIQESSRIIPISVRNRVEGDVVISFNMSGYSGSHTPYLEDRETGAFINLFQEQAYTYTVGEIGENHDRFSLHFYKVSTDLVEPKEDEVDAGKTISIKSVSGKVLISVGVDMLQEGPGIVEIYTIDGRKISEVPARSSRTLVFLPSESGIFIVRAKFGSIVKSERVIVKGQ